MLSSGRRRLTGSHAPVQRMERRCGSSMTAAWNSTRRNLAEPLGEAAPSSSKLSPHHRHTLQQPTRLAPPCRRSAPPAGLRIGRLTAASPDNGELMFAAVGEEPAAWDAIELGAATAELAALPAIGQAIGLNLEHPIMPDNQAPLLPGQSAALTPLGTRRELRAAPDSGWIEPHCVQQPGVLKMTQSPPAPSREYVVCC